MSESTSQQGSGPLVQLLARGLQLWIRSRCKAVGDLKVELQGSSAGLIRGRLEGVSLEARDVNFDGLPLQHAELNSGPVRVKVNFSRPSQAVQLEDAFSLTGNVTMKGKELNQALLSERWRWLGDLLTEELMGLTPLGGLRIDNDILELQAAVKGQSEPAIQRFSLQALSGTLQIRPLEGDGQVDLPMDPSIQIDKAVLAAGLLHLSGRANVTP